MFTSFNQIINSVNKDEGERLLFNDDEFFLDNTNHNQTQTFDDEIYFNEQKHSAFKVILYNILLLCIVI
jgi:hypothetical protein